VGEVSAVPIRSVSNWGRVWLTQCSLPPRPHPPPVFDCFLSAEAACRGSPGRSGNVWCQMDRR